MSVAVEKIELCELWASIFGRLKFDFQMRDKLVEHLLRDETGQMLLLGRQVSIDSEKMLALSEHLMAADRSEVAPFRAAVAAAVESGIRKYGWDCVSLPPPTYPPRNRPAFAEDDRPKALAAEKIESHLEIAENWNLADLPERAQRGLLFISLMFHSGVLQIPLLVDFAAQVGRPLMRARGLTFMLHSDPKLIAKQPRCLLHEYTELVYLSMSEEAFYPANRSVQSMFRDVDAYLNASGFSEKDKPSSMKELLSWVISANACRYLKDLNDYAAGAIDTTNLTNAAFARVMRVRWPENQIDQIDKIRIRHDSRVEIEVGVGSGIFDLIEAVEAGSPQTAVENLRVAFEGITSHDSSEENISLLSQWAEWRIATENYSWPRVRSDVLAGLRSGGASLYGYFGDRRVLSLSFDELLVAYAELLELQATPKAKRSLAIHLSNFHAFLNQCYALPELPSTSIVKYESGQKHVDANVLTFGEHQLGLKHLLRDPDPVSASLLADIHTLAFYHGPRTSELRDLLVDDVRLDESEIVIREHDGRGLKTFNARRRIPLSKRMGEGAFCALRNRVQSVTSTSGDEVKSDQFLFGLPEAGFTKAPDRKRISKSIHAVLRDVTGDPGMRYYTYRHSFLSWTMLGMSWPRGASFSWVGFDSDTERFLSCAEDAVRTFSGLDDEPSVDVQRRQNIFYLSRNQGHGSALTSYKHYFHFFDLLWLGHLRAYYGTESVRVVANITGLSVRTVSEATRQGRLDCLVDSYRKKKCKRVQILSPLETKSDEEWLGSVAGATPMHTLVAPRDCLNILSQYCNHGLDIDQIAARFEMDVSLVAGLIRIFLFADTQKFIARNGLLGKAVRSGDVVRKGLKEPREHWEFELFEETLGLIQQASDRDYGRTMKGLDAAVNQCSWRKNACVFRDVGECSAYIEWLNWLGFDAGRLKLIHLHGNLAQEENDNQLSYWRESLQLDGSVPIQPQCLARDKPLRPHGSMAVQVIEKLNGSNKREGSSSFAFQLAILLFYLLLSMPDGEKSSSAIKIK